MLQLASDTFAIAGYVISTLGIEVTAGMSLVTVGNTMKYGGTAIDMGLDLSRGNYRRIVYNLGSNAAMLGGGRWINMFPNRNGLSLILPLRLTAGPWDMVLKQYDINVNNRPWLLFVLFFQSWF